jgi:hypothetical protein
MSPKAETRNSTGDIGTGVGEADSEGEASTVGDSETAGVGDSEAVGELFVEVSALPLNALKIAMSKTKVITRRTVFLPLVSPGFPVATCHNSLIFELPEGEVEPITL